MNENAFALAFSVKKVESRSESYLHKECPNASIELTM
jgi:hypothetical protein